MASYREPAPALKINEWHYVPRSPVTIDSTLTPSEHKMWHVSDQVHAEVVKGIKNWKQQVEV